ncbi:MAG TPA: hypothetical protein VLZ81_02310 [Blastocatellia bacterium]|nr:hypothetical protein [Blastocatellia bacterium]
MSKKNYTDVGGGIDAEKGIALLAEIFAAIGFDIKDEESYNALAELAERSGERSCAYRAGATIHGRCWKLGGGLEVWSVLYESDRELYCADCRPAFRGRYVHKVYPWEMAEYCVDGEAVVRGALGGHAEVLFELQNLTEIKPNMLRAAQLPVGLAGLALSVRVEPETERHPIAEARMAAEFQLNQLGLLSRPPRHAEGPGDISVLKGQSRFIPASGLQEYGDMPCENDYLIEGAVLAWRNLRNPVTGAELVWIYVDAGSVRVELVANRRLVHGSLRRGAAISATAWLQGHFLVNAEVSARYEGIDPDFVRGDSWTLLRRGN